MQKFYESGRPRVFALWKYALAAVALTGMLAMIALGQTLTRQELNEPRAVQGDSVIRAVRYLTVGSLIGIALLMARANHAKRNRRNEMDE